MNNLYSNISEHNNEFLELMKICVRCDLHRSRSQVVIGDYGPKHGICFIGEAPGFNEDVQGHPFVGRSGELLSQMLLKIGLNRKDVSILNICKCRPPENRKPSRKEMQICGNLYLITQLNYLKPSLIITLGSTALNYFFPNMGMTSSRGKILVTRSGFTVFPTFHPSYILRNGHKLDAIYLQDFNKIKDHFSSMAKVKDIFYENKSNEKIDQTSLDKFF